MCRGRRKEDGRKSTGKREGRGLRCMSLLLEGCRGCGVGGEEEEEEGVEEERGGGGSLTSARLEPQWLARIQPHSAFDEGWILKLNQSHMSPTERERETERPERLGERDRGGGRDWETERRVGRRERRKEIGNGRWYRARRVEEKEKEE